MDVTQATGMELISLAGEIRPAAPAAGEQLELLGRALAANQTAEWLGVDLTQAFDPIAVESAISERHTRGERAMQWLEVARNFLVLLPITLTWVALWAAARNYLTAISPPNPPSQASFLLLWERGFDGLGAVRLPLANTFSQLAAWDAILLTLLVGITLALFSWRTIEESRTRAIAQDLRVRLERALSQAARILAHERYIKTDQLYDRFDVNARALVRGLEAAQSQSAELVTAREREAQSLTAFAENLVQGTAYLPQFAQQVTGSSVELAAAAARLETAVNALQTQQSRFTEETRTGLDRFSTTSGSIAADLKATNQSYALSLTQAEEAITGRLTATADRILGNLSNSATDIIDALKRTSEGVASEFLHANQVILAEREALSSAASALGTALAAATDSNTTLSRFAEEIGQVAARVTTDYEALRRNLMDEHEGQAVAAQELRLTAEKLGSMAASIENTIRRLHGIERNVTALMHLSAQNTDDAEAKVAEIVRAFEKLDAASDNIRLAVAALDQRQQGFTAELEGSAGDGHGSGSAARARVQQ